MSEPRFTLTRPEDVRNAWGIWIALAIGICILSVATGFTRSVTGAYAAGAERWLASADLYRDGIHGFLYLPQAALIYLPFAELPEAVGGVLWRLGSIGLFAWGLFRISQRAGRAAGVELFPLMTLLSILPSLAAMRNGQMTVPMTGCMLLATVAIADRRWWWTVFWLCLAVALKPLAIVLLLLAFALNPPLWWRLPVGIVVLLLSPYAFQSQGFVTGTYRLFIDKMAEAGNPGFDTAYSDFFGMIRVFGVDAPEGVKTAMRLLAAIGTLGCSWYAMRRFGKTSGALAMGLLALLYILLFNPRTENNTYVSIAPVVATLAAGFFLARRSLVAGWIMVVMMVLIAANFELTKHITPGRETWLCPLLGTVLGAWFVALLLRGTCPWWQPGRQAEDSGLLESTSPTPKTESKPG